jgi:hypothetical protein
MKKMKRWILTLACILLPLALATIATAQESDVPDWLSGLPLVGSFAAGLGLVLCCVVCLLPWIIWLILAIWAYKDAEKRGKSGIVWFFIVLILGIIGLIIWLIVRPKETK